MYGRCVWILSSIYFSSEKPSCLGNETQQPSILTGRNSQEFFHVIDSRTVMVLGAALELTCTHVKLERNEVSLYYESGPENKLHNDDETFSITQKSEGASTPL